jgi:hypothetical protein
MEPDVAVDVPPSPVPSPSSRGGGGYSSLLVSPGGGGSGAEGKEGRDDEEEGAGVAVDNPLSLSILRDAVGTGPDDDDALLSATSLHLEWRDLTRVGDALELVHGVRDLYLQHNFLARIEGLEALRSLEFLALGGNRITSLSGLSHLANLKVLDVSENRIEELPDGCLPPHIRIFKGSGNPVSARERRAQYRARVLALLPEVVSVDGEDVVAGAARSPGSVTSPSRTSTAARSAGSPEGVDGEGGGPRVHTSSSSSSAAALSPAARSPGSATSAGASPPSPAKEAIARSEAIAAQAAAETAAADVAIGESLARYAGRREELERRYASRLGEETQRADILTAELTRTSTASLKEARDKLQEMRERIAERSKGRRTEVGAGSLLQQQQQQQPAAAQPATAAAAGVRDWRSLAREPGGGEGGGGREEGKGE